MRKFFIFLIFQTACLLFFLFVTPLLKGQDNGAIEFDTVHIQVDMSFVVGTGLFHPITDTVDMVSSINSGTPAIMEHIGSAYLYELSYVLPVNGLYTYRFRIRAMDTIYVESADPSTRAFHMKDTTTTILRYFNNYNPGLIPMTFDCDMYYQIHAGHFSPAIDYLDIAGNFNNWGADRMELFARSNDSIYSLTVFYDTASIPVIPFRFKFRFNGDTATMELKGDSNRIYTMTPVDHHFTCWYNNLDPNIPALPFVYDVTIQDSIISKHTVTGAYSYEDYNLKPEGKSIYQWYTADSTGGVLTAIDSAWHINYTIDSLLIGKYLVFEVKPITVDSVVGLPVQAWSATKIVGVGMDELQQVSARIYPNPVQEQLYIEPSKKLKVLEFINITGQVLFSMKEINEKKIRLNIQNIPGGIYILRITARDNSTAVLKIIKN